MEFVLLRASSIFFSHAIWRTVASCTNAISCDGLEVKRYGKVAIKIIRGGVSKRNEANGARRHVPQNFQNAPSITIDKKNVCYQ